MPLNSRIINLNEEQDYRLICVSDIHGGLDLFKKLIEKVDFKQSDYLVIIGDFIEKGKFNKETLLYIKELSEKDNIIVLSGNCEAFISRLILQKNNCKKIMRYIKYKPHKSIFDEWIEELNINIDEIDGDNLQNILIQNYKDDIEFLGMLPIALEIEDFIFVHAGINEKEDWKESTLKTFLYCEQFYKKNNKSGKTVVVGHWPASNYRDYSINCDSIIDNEKKIICIDGGYNVKKIAQLNALIIEKTNGEYNIYNESADEFHKYIVIEDSFGTKEIPRKIGWPNNRIEIIEHKKEFSVCKRLDTGELINVKNEIIELGDEGYYCNQDYQEYYLTVDKGQVIDVVDIYGSYALATLNGEYGWIKKNFIEKL
ncbi:metallophosphoesterase [Tepidibacter hydrothermalis]|uniref:Metallophosphoesterase n=1 Tax=Tepidibacter hydrothermalis TaxID=3036126 RepID=A0ABY8EBA2_9FIRM|nr:metallophosphoesterase [Tepidibacter hydrothermalis]WFD08869.1 metallophosphoesterase [Tepidibacter hydrothermalis]